MPESAHAANNPDLQRQLDELQLRVAALERRLSLPPVQATVSVSSNRSDTAFSLTIVNRIGALTLAIGILFFFKYAADNGWIGPVARVWIGIVIGLFLMGTSEWIDRWQGRLVSQGLAACGLATLFISLYASYGYYNLIVPAAAFIFLLVLSQGIIVLSVKRKNLAITVLGLFGTLLVPQLVHLAQPGTWAVFEAVYLFLLQSECLFIATKQNNRYLVPFSATAVTITALVAFEPRGYLPFFLLALCLSVLHFAVSTMDRFIWQPVRLNAYVLGHCFSSIAAFRAIWQWAPNGATASTIGSVLLAIYGIALLAIGLAIAKAAAANRTLGLAFLTLVVAKLYLYDIWQLNYAARITAFVVLGALLLAASFLYSRTKPRDH